MHISSSIGAAIVLASIAALPEPANAGGWWHNEDVLEVRVGPGVAYAKLVLVPKHQRVQVYHCTGWCEVSWGAYHGYVQTKYVVNVLSDPANLTPKHHRPYVTPVFADHLTVTPVGSDGSGYLTPVYVPPAPAYLTSQVIAPYGGKPVGRIWYYQGRWLDHPDYFYDIGR
jgi:uncharacterized protein YraI